MLRASQHFVKQLVKIGRDFAEYPLIFAPEKTG